MITFTLEFKTIENKLLKEIFITYNLGQQFYKNQANFIKSYHSTIIYLILASIQYYNNYQLLFLSGINC